MGQTGNSLQTFAWIRDAATRAAAIVGICKNAGKTTLLNHLLAANPELGFGVFSTGIDGEDLDTVYRTPKPKVCLNSGQIFCCGTETLDSHGGNVRILDRLACSTPTRPLWLARAESALQTEITGPASVTDQIGVLRRMRELGAPKVLIDGSLDRKSIALSDAVDSVAVVIGASFGPLGAVIAEVKRLVLLNSLPAAADPLPGSEAYLQLRDAGQMLIRKDHAWLTAGIHSLIGAETQLRELADLAPERIYIPGAITDEVLRKIREPLLALRAPLLFRHPDCLKLSLRKLEQFLADFPLEVLIPFRIKTFALNTLAVGAAELDAEDFRARLRKEFHALNLIDLKELKR